MEPFISPLCRPNNKRMMMLMMSLPGLTTLVILMVRMLTMKVVPILILMRKSQGRTFLRPLLMFQHIPVQTQAWDRMCRMSVLPQHKKHCASARGPKFQAFIRRHPCLSLLTYIYKLTFLVTWLYIYIYRER